MKEKKIYQKTNNKNSIIIIWVKQTNLGDLTLQSFQERITSKFSSKLNCSNLLHQWNLSRVLCNAFEKKFLMMSSDVHARKYCFFFRLVSYDNNCWNESSWFLSKCLLTGTLPWIKLSKHSHRKFLKLFGDSLRSFLKLHFDRSINCFSIHSSLYLNCQICCGSFGGR